MTITVGRVFLVRHGRTTLNADGRLRGHLNPPLDSVGMLEADALAGQLAQFRLVRILASPLNRTMQTAWAIAERAQLSVVAAPDLVDRDYGEWAGEREADIIRRWGAIDLAPGVEALASVAARALAVLNDQLPHLESGDVVLVSHDAVNRALLQAVAPELGEHLHQRTACWNELHPTDGQWKVIATDQKPDHLRGSW